MNINKNNNLFSISLFFIMISSVYLQNSVFNSYKFQKILLSDLSNNTNSFSLSQIKDIPEYPSLAVNSIPIKSIKARYLLDYDQIIMANEFADEGLIINPYIVYSYYIMARILLKERKLYKSLDYLRKGFEISKNVDYLSSLYFSLLSSLNLKKELIDAFDKIIESDNPDIWKFYYLSIKELSDSNQDFIDIVVKTASKQLNLSYLEFTEFVNK